MYTSIYLYCVPKEHIKRFLHIQQKAAELYKQFGAIEDITLQAQQLDAKYGCLPFTHSFPLKDNQVLMIGMTSFRDLSHHNEVMKLADTDPLMNELYNEVISIIPIQQITRGEFERVV